MKCEISDLSVIGLHYVEVFTLFRTQPIKHRAKLRREEHRNTEMKQISLFVILFLGLESFGFHISPARTALRIKALSHKTNNPFRYNQPRYIGQHFAEINEGEEEEKLLENEEDVNEASKRQMLGFAIPALGIFLCNPLLSNIDNAFVGRMSGTSGLAALSPGKYIHAC